MLSGEDIRAFSLTHNDQWILFPYRLNNEGAELFSKKVLRSSYPEASRYLKACESRLKARERGRMDTEEWWAFGRSQNLDQFEQPKVMLPGFNDAPAAGFDRDGRYYHVSGYSITLSEQSFIDLQVLTALLNSRLLFWTLRHVGVALQRGFVEFRPQYLDRLPIARPSDKQKAALGSIVARGSRDGYASVSEELDRIVYQVYGLTEDEIAAVEVRAKRESRTVEEPV